MRVELAPGVEDLLWRLGEHALTVEVTLDFEGDVLKQAVAFPGAGEPSLGFQRVRVGEVDVWWRQRLVLASRAPRTTGKGSATATTPSRRAILARSAPEPRVMKTAWGPLLSAKMRSHRTLALRNIATPMVRVIVLAATIKTICSDSRGRVRRSARAWRRSARSRCGPRSG